MKKGIPVIKLEWDGELPTFFCPVCGHTYWSEEPSSEEPCKHILFSFISEAPDITIHKKGIEEKFNSLIRQDAVNKSYAWNDESDDIQTYCNEELDFDEKVNILAESVDSESAFCLEMTSNGMACGPVSFGAVIAVDYNVNE